MAQPGSTQRNWGNCLYSASQSAFLALAIMLVCGFLTLRLRNRYLPMIAGLMVLLLSFSLPFFFRPNPASVSALVMFWYVIGMGVFRSRKDKE